MSSPPPSATSPTSSTGFGLSNPKKRGPSLQIPASNKRRKPSSVSSASHPLRQASFPPPDDTYSGNQGSPSGRHDSFSPSASSFGGKRGRGGKKRGGPSRASTVTGNARDGDARSAGPQSSQVGEGGGGGGGDEQDGEQADEEANLDDMQFENNGQMTDAAREQEQRYLQMLMKQLSKDQEDRYVIWRRVKLRNATLKRLVNATLSQSVPQPIATTVGGYTKVFMGELIEMARDVQAEWLAAERSNPKSKHPSALSQKSQASTNSSANGVNGTQLSTAGSASTSQDAAAITSPTGQSQGQTGASASMEATQDAGFQPQSDKLSAFDFEENDRGPLTPDHLREALRRYKKDREGGSSGFTGHSMVGKEATATRTGGKRLFR